MRLINADKLINSIQHELWDWESVDGIASSTVLKQTISDIKNEPTIDAVPVIRCKDCRWYAHKYDGYHSECDLFKMCFDPDDYCSRAERKEDEIN